MAAQVENYRDQRHRVAPPGPRSMPGPVAMRFAQVLLYDAFAPTRIRRHSTWLTVMDSARAGTRLARHLAEVNCVQ
jgi:hypothetical protein